MKYIITERQYRLLEYFDPIYYLKNKFLDKPKDAKDPEYIKYEDRFQNLVDTIFKYVKTEGELKHLKGFKVLKTTPSHSYGGPRWAVVIAPIVDDYFNWKENSKFMEQLDEFIEKFKDVSKVVSSPYVEEGLPEDVEFNFWLY